MVLTDQFLAIIISLVFIWLTVLTAIIFKAFQTYRRLTADIDKKDFAEVLTQIKKQLKNTDQDLSDVEAVIEKIQTDLKSHIQKLGFVRYNPFGNTGGDQSFCLCLLDDRDSGIMITSLHARNQTRLYAKPIKNGKNQDGIELSKEEALCIKQAKSWSHS